MNKLLIISGPTATGKTALAIKLANKFNGELISADSRQIYQGMNIGTGKDHPKGVKIHLVDIINPNQTFSVAQYRQLALEKIREIQNQNKLPIIVGGTGQYIDSIINPQPTFNIKPNQLLRFFLNKFSLKLLQFTLRTLDFQTFNSLNRSDSANSHRLIRKIEIKLSRQHKLVPPLSSKRGLGGDFVFHLSLTASNDFLYQQINSRVQKRLNLGLFDEIKSLLKKYKWSAPGLNTLAYKEFKTGFGQKNIDCWRFDEHRYARRQKTWFKKQKNFTYIDIQNSTYPQNAVDLVEEWYNKL